MFVPHDALQWVMLGRCSHLKHGRPLEHQAQGGLALTHVCCCTRDNICAVLDVCMTDGSCCPAAGRAGPWQPRHAWRTAGTSSARRPGPQQSSQCRMFWIAAMPVTARVVCSETHVLKPSYKCTGHLRAEELHMVCTLR